MGDLKYLSMFSGIGGFEKAIRKVYPNWECIGYSEIDKYAIQIFNNHFKGIKNYGDATKIDTTELPEFDILVGGFPCQAFSIAGKRKGFEDTRGTLFFEIARILRDKRPRYFLLENVKGLLSHDGGKTFSTILGVLSDLGYEFQWQVLNSKNFGVPQNRERVFIVGNLGGVSRPQVFPVSQSNPISNEANGREQKSREGIRGEISSTLDARYGALRNSGETYLKYVGGIVGERKKWLDDGKDNSRNFSQGQRVYSPDGIASTLAGNAGGLGGKTGLYAMQWRRTEKGKEERRKAQAEGHDYTPFSDGCRELVPKPDKPIGAITAQAVAKDSLLGNETQIRRLTPTECERLQGFPEIEKYVIIKVCLDHQKNCVNVEIKNPKLLKFVGNVERKDLKENVLSVEKSLNQNKVKISKLVQQNVLIDCVENGVEIHSQGKLLLSAKFAEKKNWCHPHIKIDDFVQMLVGINTIKEKIINCGKEELPQNEQFLTVQQNGKKQEKSYGKEIMQPVGSVENDLITLKELLKFTMLNHSDTENLEQKLKILSLFVIRAINGYIPKEILNQDTFTVGIKTKVGYTYGVSDTQKYKCLGNAVTVNVVEYIINHLNHEIL